MDRAPGGRDSGAYPDAARPVGERVDTGRVTSLPFGALFGPSDAPGSGAATPPPPTPLRSGAGAGTRQATPEREPSRDQGEGNAAFREFFAAMSRGTLTSSEERELRPKLVEAFLHTSDSLDDFLSSSNRRRDKAEIWSTIDEDDARTLADALLMLGKKSAPVAGVVRMVADSWLGVRALQILGPRLWQTALWYPQHGGFAL